MIEVSAGILCRGGQVLICQRAYGEGCAGLWEFPGGKREPGETAEACLVRECREELAVEIGVTRVFETFEWTRGKTPLRFTFLLAHIISGEPVCLEHAQIAWVSPGALETYSFCPADASIVGVISAYLR